MRYLDRGETIYQATQALMNPPGAPPPDSMKKDFQNARKRNLHSWAEWRTLVNEQLVEAMRTGHPMDEAIVPLETYMCGNKPISHPTQNPKMLLTYSASEDTSTNLRRKHFISYGIPRAHLDPMQEGLSVLNSRRSQLGAAAPGEGYAGYSAAPPPGVPGREDQKYAGERRASPVPRQHRSAWDLSSCVDEPEFTVPAHRPSSPGHGPSSSGHRSSSAKKGKLPRTYVPAAAHTRLPRQGYH